MGILIIISLPTPVNKGYVLCDSWYSNKKLFTVSKEVAYTYIGGLRTNRVIYPHGKERLGIKLNDAKNSLIALCWPNEDLFKVGSPL